MSMLFYINKIVRDDGQKLTFDRSEIFLSDDNANLTMRPDVETTSVEYTEADGGEMVAQRLASYDQEINGIIAPKVSSYWDLRTMLGAFFQTKHTYYIVYEKSSGDDTSEGDLFKSGEAWISSNLQIPPTPRELYSPWTVTLHVGTPGYQEYAEDPGGKEAFANIVNIGLITASTGGSEWDSVGQNWDSVGQVYVAGEGGLQTINASTSQTIYPVWEVEGPVTNPSIYNDSTATEAEYDGTISSGQTLTVDFTTGTASIDGVIVSGKLTGELTLKNGTNYVGFDIGSGTISSSTLKWNNYIG